MNQDVDQSQSLNSPYQSISIPFKYGGGFNRPLSASIKKSYTNGPQHAKTSSDIVTRNLSSVSSIQILQHADDNTKQIYNESTTKIEYQSQPQTYRAKGVRPKTASRKQKEMNLTFYNINSCQFVASAKSHQKNQLSKSFRALSRRHNHASQNQDIHSPPQFFTKKLLIDTQNVKVQPFKHITLRQQKNVSVMYDDNQSNNGRIFSVRIPAALESEVHDEEKSQIFDQPMNIVINKKHNKEQHNIMNRIIHNRQQ